MRIPLANLLVRSPLPRVSELMEQVVVCAQHVPQIVHALIDGDQTAVERLAKEVSALEARADEAKDSVRSNLPVRIFLPVDRRDVLKLISQIDSIADCSEDVGVLLTIRPLQVPEEMKTILVLFTERVLETVKTAADLVATMDDLLEQGFSGPAKERVLSLAKEVGRKEHEADKLQDQCARVLFRSEDQMSAVAIFMWTKVLNKIGDIANHAENVGDQFRLLVAG